MTKRNFKEQKLQDIYNEQFAKEIAKIDAEKEKNDSCVTLWMLLTIGCFYAGSYLFTRLFC